MIPYRFIDPFDFRLVSSSFILMKLDFYVKLLCFYLGYGFTLDHNPILQYAWFLEHMIDVMATIPQSQQIFIVMLVY